MKLRIRFPIDYTLFDFALLVVGACGKEKGLSTLVDWEGMQGSEAEEKPSISLREDGPSLFGIGLA